MVVSRLGWVMVINMGGREQVKEAQSEPIMATMPLTARRQRSPSMWVKEVG